MKKERKKRPAVRTRQINIALTVEEYDGLQEKFKATTFHVFSDYIRARIFQTPVITRYHNCSLDKFVLMAGDVQGSLDAIRRDLSRAVKTLQQLPPTEPVTAALSTLLSTQAEVTQHVAGIKTFFLKIYEHANHDQTMQGNGESPVLQ